MTHQEAACSMASIHFDLMIRRTDILVYDVMVCFGCSWVGWLFKSAFQVTSQECDLRLRRLFIFHHRTSVLVLHPNRWQHLSLCWGLWVLQLCRALPLHQNQSMLMRHPHPQFLLDHVMAAECGVKQLHGGQ